MSQTVAELVGQAVARLGAGHAFGVVGSGNFAVTNALRAAGVAFVAARHEGGAATMADAFARTSGQVAVLTVHQGCGLTNAATGITEAAKSRTPLLVLAADTAAGAVRSNFRIDQDGLAASLGAVPLRVRSAQSALTEVVQAWRTARDERRTVVLSLPLDVQAAPAPEGDRQALETLTAAPRPAPTEPDERAVAELTERLQAARRPVFVAGRGARAAGPVLRELAQECGALLATSAVAHGLFAGDPFALGISGGFSSPAAAELIHDADLVVAWGCTLSMWTMRHGRLLGDDAVVVQVDLEAEALGINRRVDQGVVGDVGRTAAAVLARWRPADRQERRYRQDGVRARIRAQGRWNDVPTPDLSGPDPAGRQRIDPRLLSAELDRRLPVARLVCVDSGNFMGYPAAYLRVGEPAGFCFTQAYQSIGLGLGTLVGAALARPDLLPVLATGDGGFLMAVADLETLVRLRLPAVVVVYDDAAYGAEVHHFGPDGADLGAVTFPDVDLAAVARGFGAHGLTVRTPADLDGLGSWLAGPRDAPLVVDAKIASDGGSWWLAEAFRGH